MAAPKYGFIIRSDGTCQEVPWSSKKALEIMQTAVDGRIEMVPAYNRSRIVAYVNDEMALRDDLDINSLATVFLGYLGIVMSACLAHMVLGDVFILLKGDIPFTSDQIYSLKKACAWFSKTGDPENVSSEIEAIMEGIAPAKKKAKKRQFVAAGPPEKKKKPAGN
jgi:hypothetical protein